MPLDEGGKGRFVVMLDEAAEQLAVVKAGAVMQKGCPANVFDHIVHWANRHFPPSAGVFACSNVYLPQDDDLIHKKMSIYHAAVFFCTPFLARRATPS
jgi:hypothetical protein